MKYQLIACNVFKKELEHLIPDSPHELEVEYLELGEHARPNRLRSKIQEIIDRPTDCEAVLLCYGLCGRATDGLAARSIPLIIHRSHDCCGILLGSRKRFEELFKPMPSTPFASIGFAENGDYYFQDQEMMRGDAYASLVEQYGEEDAKYIWDAMHPKLDGKLQPVHFIHTLPAPEILCQCRSKAAAEGRGFIEVDGDLRLLRMLLAGFHPSDEFLTVPPGQTIHQTGDWNQIIKAVKTAYRSGSR